ncbi:hypothetical protein ACFL54_08510 [Planctomycetota bacterium]
MHSIGNKLRVVFAFFMLAGLLSGFALFAAGDDLSEEAGAFALKFKVANAAQLAREVPELKLQLKNTGSQLPDKTLLRVDIYRIYPQLHCPGGGSVSRVLVHSSKQQIANKQFDFVVQSLKPASTAPGRYEVLLRTEARQQPIIKKQLGEAIKQLGARRSVWLGPHTQSMEMLPREWSKAGKLIADIERIAADFYQLLTGMATQDAIILKPEFRATQQAIIDIRRDAHLTKDNCVMRDLFDRIFFIANVYLTKQDMVTNPVRIGDTAAANADANIDANLVDFRTYAGLAKVDLAGEILLNLQFLLMDALDFSHEACATGNTCPDVEWDKLFALANTAWDKWRQTYHKKWAAKIRTDIGNCSDPDVKAPQVRADINIFLINIENNNISKAWEDYIASLHAASVTYTKWADSPSNKTFKTSARNKAATVKKQQADLLRVLRQKGTIKED